MSEQSGDSVLFPGVDVEVNIERDGDPLILILTRPNGVGRATIAVSARGVDEVQLCSVLRVIATTIDHATRPEVEGGRG